MRNFVVDLIFNFAWNCWYLPVSGQSCIHYMQISNPKLTSGAKDIVQNEFIHGEDKSKNAV